MHEVARIPTGWGAYESGFRAGEFRFDQDAHDYRQKEVLGRIFPEGRGAEEVDELLDMLVDHPSTAQFIAGKLVRRFVADDPPPTLVSQVADAFGADGDIKEMLRVIFLSDEFQAPESDYTGWLGRHLATLDTGNGSPLRAIGIGDVLQRSLITPIESGINPTAIQSIATYGLHATHKEVLRAQIEAFYAQDTSLLHAIAQQILETSERLSQLPVPDPGDYPQHAFGNQLRDTAQLIKADLGVELACLDLEGWDTHRKEGAGGAPDAYLSRQLSILGQGLAAFYKDLDGLMDQVTPVVMSEFGRQLKENGSQGTDHGRGGFMMVMGGNQVAGGQVFVNQGWQMLQDLRDQGEIDLNVLTDYRDVLGEILRLRLNNGNLSQIFPEYSVTEHGLVTA